MTYASRFAEFSSVVVDLDGVADDGDPTAPENDNIGGDVEHLTGTVGNDTLRGSVAPNIISGLAGDDVIEGAAGNDILLGGEGKDTERGQNGDDRLGARPIKGTIFSIPPTADSGTDSFDGGPGIDTIYSADAETDERVDCGDPNPVEFGGDHALIDLVDFAPFNCENVDRAAKDQHPTVQVEGLAKRTSTRVARVRLRCPGNAPGTGCSGTVSIVRGGRTVGSARYALRRGRGRGRTDRAVASSGRPRGGANDREGHDGQAGNDDDGSEVAMRYVVALALCLLVAGCGGDDDEEPAVERRSASGAKLRATVDDSGVRGTATLRGGRAVDFTARSSAEGPAGLFEVGLDDAGNLVGTSRGGKRVKLEPFVRDGRTGYRGDVTLKDGDTVPYELFVRGGRLTPDELAGMKSPRTVILPDASSRGILDPIARKGKGTAQ